MIEKPFQNGVTKNAGWLINATAESVGRVSYIGYDNFGLKYANRYMHTLTLFKFQIFKFFMPQQIGSKLKH